VVRRSAEVLVVSIVLLLLASAWRPACPSTGSTDLHAHHKRPRKAVTDLPELDELLTGGAARDHGDDARFLVHSLKSLPSAVEPSAAARIDTDVLRRPRYLQASQHRELHSALAPPAC